MCQASHDTVESFLALEVYREFATEQRRKRRIRAKVVGSLTTSAAQEGSTSGRCMLPPSSMAVLTFNVAQGMLVAFHTVLLMVANYMNR
jgi:hypothetical protein